MTRNIKTKNDAITCIDELYPIGGSPDLDSIWIEELEHFGLENLPIALLKSVASRMVEKVDDVS